MRRRPFSRAIVWGRSGALFPAMCVALTAVAVIAVLVLPVLAALTHGRPAARAGIASDTTAGVPTLVAAMLSAYIAALLASFTIVRRGIDGLIDDKLRILARVEQVRAGVPLPEEQRFDTIARLSRRAWVTREEARAVAGGQADDRVMAYLLDNLAPQSKVTRRAARRLMAVAPPKQRRGARRPLTGGCPARPSARGPTGGRGS